MRYPTDVTSMLLGTMSAATNNENSTVLIIGAGASGLTAGYDLKRKGYKVTILEATSKLGGRLQKLEGFASFPIDLGGQWVHVNPRILETIVNDPNVKVKVKTVRHVSDFAEYKGDGKWTRESKYDPKDYLIVNYTYHDFFKDYIGETVKDDIVYNCPINAIDYSNDTIVARSNDGREFTADRIIVTVPLKILQDEYISFNPPLPDNYQNAIQSPTFPEGLKIFLKFREKFYRQAFEIKSWDYWGERYFWDETYGQDTTDNILAVFSIGQIAEEKYTKRSDEEIIKSVLEELDEAYEGKATPNFIDGHVQNWRNEPFVRGAYSFRFPSGYWPLRVLRRPLQGKIFFAGEAIPNEYEHGYAHEAALSGRRAAAYIMQGVRDDSGGCCECLTAFIQDWIL